MNEAANTRRILADRDDAVIKAAREIIAAQTYCAIVTVGAEGRPQVRTMNPFPPEDDMTVWMATNSRSRKIEEIRRDPRVCLYYADHANAIGSVAIHGRAELVDDMDEKLKRKRDYWDDSFPDWRYLLLIKVVPERIEVLNYARDVNNEGDSWTVPAVELPAALGHKPAEDSPASSGRASASASRR